MDIVIKDFYTRKEFEATNGNMRLVGAYKTNKDFELTDISGTAYFGEGSIDVRGTAEGHLENGSIKYNYNHVTDDDIEAVRALTVFVVDSTRSTSSSSEGGEA